MLSAVVGVFIGAWSWPAFSVVIGIFRGMPIQFAGSRQTIHLAELSKKYNFDDMNFIVRLDGEKIYGSPELLGCDSWRPCGEVLVWDDSGRVVALKVIGKTIFAYNVEKGRELGKGELASYKFSLPDYEERLLKDLDE